MRPKLLAWYLAAFPALTCAAEAHNPYRCQLEPDEVVTVRMTARTASTLLSSLRRGQFPYGASFTSLYGELAPPLTSLLTGADLPIPIKVIEVSREMALALEDAVGSGQPLAAETSQQILAALDDKAPSGPDVATMRLCGDAAPHLKKILQEGKPLTGLLGKAVHLGVHEAIETLTQPKN